MFRKLCLSALIVFVFGSGAYAQGAVQDLDNPIRGSGKTINMPDYMLPPQNANSEKQYYMLGYMRCLAGECARNGEPPYAYNGFTKQLVTGDGSNGKYFATMKATDPTHLFGYPCEYYVAREGQDENGKKTNFIYIEWEMMDWLRNQGARGYHDSNGSPTFEIARSNAVPEHFYVQNVPECQETVCERDSEGNLLLEPNGQPKYSETYRIAPGGYYVLSYKFDKAGIDKVNVQLVSLGLYPVEPKWIGMTGELGGGEKADLMIMVSLWGWTPDFSSDPELGGEEWRWWYRELYYYLKGVGWVAWVFQVHDQDDRMRPFVTSKVGVLDTIVWEGEKKIRPLLLCEKVPGQSGGVHPFAEARSFGFSYRFRQEFMNRIRIVR